MSAHDSRDRPRSVLDKIFKPYIHSDICPHIYLSSWDVSIIYHWPLSVCSLQTDAAAHIKDLNVCANEEMMDAAQWDTKEQ